MKNFINKHHIIRRSLLIVFTYFFLKITYNIFLGEITLNIFMVSIYGIFTGIEILFIKFYFDSRNIEDKTKNEDILNE